MSRYADRSAAAWLVILTLFLSGCGFGVGHEPEDVEIPLPVESVKCDLPLECVSLERDRDFDDIKDLHIIDCAFRLRMQRCLELCSDQVINQEPKCVIDAL